MNEKWMARFLEFLLCYCSLTFNSFPRIGSSGCSKVVVSCLVQLLKTRSPYSLTPQASFSHSRFDSKGNYEKSPALLIRAGDGGTDVGNSILEARHEIFPLTAFPDCVRGFGTGGRLCVFAFPVRASTVSPTPPACLNTWGKWEEKSVNTRGLKVP